MATSHAGVLDVPEFALLQASKAMLARGSKWLGLCCIRILALREEILAILLK